MYETVDSFAIILSFSYNSFDALAHIKMLFILAVVVLDKHV